MAFQDDLIYDLENSFLDASGNGLAITCTHRDARTDVTTLLVPVLYQPLQFSIFDQQRSYDQRHLVHFYFNSADVLVRVNDEVTVSENDGDHTFRILKIKREGAMQACAAERHDTST